MVGRLDIKHFLACLLDSGDKWFREVSSIRFCGDLPKLTIFRFPGVGFIGFQFIRDRLAMAVPSGPHTLAQLGRLLDRTIFLVVSQVFWSRDRRDGPFTQFSIHHDKEEQVATVSGSPSTPISSITVVTGHAWIPPIPVAAAVADRRLSSVRSVAP